MLRIALSTLGSRRNGTLGALAAVGMAVVLVVSCGILLQSSLRAPVPVERLSGAPLVAQGTPTLAGIGNVSVSLPERKRLPAALAGRLSRLPGVRAAVADRSFDAQLLDRRGRLLTGPDRVPAVGHGWDSAALTPFALRAGHAPRSPDELVLAGDLAARGPARLGDRLELLSASGRQSFTVAGIAATRQRLSRESPVFFRDDVAARLSGGGERADLIGVLLKPGTDRGTWPAGCAPPWPSRACGCSPAPSGARPSPPRTL